MDQSLSLSGIILLGLLFVAVGIAGTWYVLRSKILQLQAICTEREAELRESQKAVYERERAFLDERNKLEIAYTENLKQAKSEAYEQGREFGKVEGGKAHLEEIIALKTEFSAKLAAEVDTAVTEARKRLTVEYELQTKLFTVQISPFVRISEKKRYFSSEFDVETGYQYQLLVNGIPAFQPHSIIERSESRSEVNEENVKELISIAKDFASNAIDTYLGAGGGKFAKLASVIVKNLPKR